MIKTFLNKNKLAIKTGLAWMSIIFTLVVLIIFLVGYLNGTKLHLESFLIVILGAAVGFPIFATTVGFLRWRWDYSVTNRNFNSFPFNELDLIGFEKLTKNEDSKSKFTSEFYTKNLGGFTVDCDVNTRYDSNKLVFKVYIKTEHIDRTKLNEIKSKLAEINGFLDFDYIGKKYHYKRHHLYSVEQLELELLDLVNVINMENFKSKTASR